MEYILIVLALIFIYGALFAHFVDVGARSVYDVEKMIKTKFEMMRLKVAGEFLASGSGGEINSLLLALPPGVEVDVGSQLSARVPVTGSYAICSASVCTIGMTAPFTNSTQIQGTVRITIRKRGGALEVIT